MSREINEMVLNKSIPREVEKDRWKQCIENNVRKKREDWIVGKMDRGGEVSLEADPAAWWKKTLIMLVVSILRLFMYLGV